MQLSTTGVGTLLTSLAWLFFYYSLKNRDSSENSFVKYFKAFSIHFGLFFLVFSIPSILFSNQPTVLGVSYLIGHIFCYIAMAYLVRIGLLLAKPSMNSKGFFIAYLIAGGFATILNIINFNRPYIQDNVMQWDQVPFVAATIGVLTMIAFLPVAILFIKEAVINPKNRLRYGLIGAALLITIVCGPLHDATKSVLILSIADGASVVACTLAYLGVISGSKSKTKRKK